MTYSRIDSRLANLFLVGLDHDVPQRMEAWREHLAQGRMTAEMREVFTALGYPVPRRQPTRKVKAGEEEDTPEDIGAAVDAEEAEAWDHQPPVVRFAHGDEPLSDYEPEDTISRA